MLHFNTVSPALLKIIESVSGEPFFKDFRLVGGTALSLYLGHRMSVDADFFADSEFDKREAEAALLRLLPGFFVMKESPHGFAGVFEGVKIDLYRWSVPFLLPEVEEKGIRLAAIPDIVALKLDAIVGRKEEKDFRDIHALLSVFSLAEMFGFYRERIPHRDLRLVSDHLAAVSAADRQQPIHLIHQIEWKTVVAEIETAIRNHIADIRSQKEKAEAERLQNLQNLLKSKQTDPGE